MRKRSKGVRSLAEVSVMPKQEIIAGDAGRHYDGLRRFQQEEKERAHQENLAKLDIIAHTENDPVLAARCPLRLTEFDDPQQAQQSLIAAAERFRLRRKAEGIELNAKAQAFFRTILLRNPELAWYDPEPENENNCWDTAWAYFVSLGAQEKFGLVQPAPKRVDPLEQLNGEDRAQLEAMRDFVYEQGWADEVADVVAQFLVHLKRTFTFQPTKTQLYWVYRFICDNNLAWLDGSSWDKARIAGVKKGILPLSLLTDDDRLAWKIDDEPTSLSDFQTKEKYLRKLHRRETVEEPASLRSSTDVSLGR